MAETTNIEISPDDGWTEVATSFTAVSVKANTGNWKSWRLYISNSGAPDDPDVGNLYNGNKTFMTDFFTGTVYIRVLENYDPVEFSIIKEEEAAT